MDQGRCWRALLLFLLPLVSAQTITWVGPSSGVFDWNDATKWSPTLPTANSDVFISPSTSLTILNPSISVLASISCQATIRIVPPYYWNLQTSVNKSSSVAAVRVDTGANFSAIGGPISIATFIIGKNVSVSSSPSWSSSSLRVEGNGTFVFSPATLNATLINIQISQNATAIVKGNQTFSFVQMYEHSAFMIAKGGVAQFGTGSRIQGSPSTTFQVEAGAKVQGQDAIEIYYTKFNISGDVTARNGLYVQAQSASVEHVFAASAVVRASNCEFSGPCSYATTFPAGFNLLCASYVRFRSLGTCPSGTETRFSYLNATSLNATLVRIEAATLALAGSSLFSAEYSLENGNLQPLGDTSVAKLRGSGTIVGPSTLNITGPSSVSSSLNIAQNATVVVSGTLLANRVVLQDYSCFHVSAGASIFSTSGFNGVEIQGSATSRVETMTGSEWVVSGFIGFTAPVYLGGALVSSGDVTFQTIVEPVFLENCRIVSSTLFQIIGESARNITVPASCHINAPRIRLFSRTTSAKYFIGDFSTFANFTPGAEPTRLQVDDSALIGKGGFVGSMIHLELKGLWFGGSLTLQGAARLGSITSTAYIYGTGTLFIADDIPIADRQNHEINLYGNVSLVLQGRTTARVIKLNDATSYIISGSGILETLGGLYYFFISGPSSTRFVVERGGRFVSEGGFSAPSVPSISIAGSIETSGSFSLVPSPSATFAIEQFARFDVGSLDIWVPCDLSSIRLDPGVRIKAASIAVLRPPSCPSNPVSLDIPCPSSTIHPASTLKLPPYLTVFANGPFASGTTFDMNGGLLNLSCHASSSLLQLTSSSYQIRLAGNATLSLFAGAANQSLSFQVNASTVTMLSSIHIASAQLALGARVLVAPGAFISSCGMPISSMASSDSSGGFLLSASAQQFFPTSCSAGSMANQTEAFHGSSLICARGVACNASGLCCPMSTGCCGSICCTATFTPMSCPAPNSNLTCPLAPWNYPTPCPFGLNGIVCSGRGFCKNSQCVCVPKFQGSSCEIEITPTPRINNCTNITSDDCLPSLVTSTATSEVLVSVPSLDCATIPVITGCVFNSVFIGHGLCVSRGSIRCSVPPLVSGAYSVLLAFGNATQRTVPGKVSIQGSLKNDNLRSDDDRQYLTEANNAISWTPVPGEQYVSLEVLQAQLDDNRSRIRFVSIPSLTLDIPNSGVFVLPTTAMESGHYIVHVSTSGNSSTIRRVIGDKLNEWRRLTKIECYGNYCGRPAICGQEESYGRPAIDSADAACMNHDKCYDWAAHSLDSSVLEIFCDAKLLIDLGNPVLCNDQECNDAANRMMLFFSYKLLFYGVPRLQGLVAKPYLHVLALAWGDVHYTTFDSCAYTFNIPGDYVLTRSLDLNNETYFEIQVRNEPPRGTNHAVTFTSTIAILPCRLCQIIEIGVDKMGSFTAKLAGVATYIGIGTGTVSLQGAELRRTDIGDMTIDFDAGVSVRLQAQEQPYRFSAISLTSSVQAPQVEGLLGNANSDPSDDFKAPNGTSFESCIYASSSIVDAFGRAWSVKNGSSLFSQPFRDLWNFGNYPSRLDDILLAPSVVSNFEIGCASALSPQTSNQALFDFAVLGQNESACAASLQVAEVQRSLDAVQIFVDSTLYNSSTILVSIRNLNLSAISDTPKAQISDDNNPSWIDLRTASGSQGAAFFATQLTPGRTYTARIRAGPTPWIYANSVPVPGCAPTCFSYTCGDDGCGGTCPPCAGSATCISGLCLQLAPSAPTSEAPNIAPVNDGEAPPLAPTPTQTASAAPENQNGNSQTGNGGVIAGSIVGVLLLLGAVGGTGFYFRRRGWLFWRT